MVAIDNGVSLPAIVAVIIVLIILVIIAGWLEREYD